MSKLSKFEVNPSSIQIGPVNPRLIRAVPANIAEVIGNFDDNVQDESQDYNLALSKTDGTNLDLKQL